MEDQEFFDKVKTHLLTQNAKSISPTGYCKYRFGGLSCAIGCCIPDEVYDSAMEMLSSDILIELFPNLNVYFGSPELSRRLQRLHDNVEVAEWESALNLLEEEFFGKPCEAMS